MTTSSELPISHSRINSENLWFKEIQGRRSLEPKTVQNKPKHKSTLTHQQPCHLPLQMWGTPVQAQFYYHLGPAFLNHSRKGSSSGRCLLQRDLVTVKPPGTLPQSRACLRETPRCWPHHIGGGIPRDVGKNTKDGIDCVTRLAGTCCRAKCPWHPRCHFHIEIPTPSVEKVLPWASAWPPLPHTVVLPPLTASQTCTS